MSSGMRRPRRRWSSIPGDEGEILEVLKYHQLKLKYIIDTHGHFDHVDANQP